MKRFYNIAVFVPHKGCPNDCVFCNQKRITGVDEEISAEKTDEIIKNSIATIDKNIDRYTEIAFFGGSFTGIDKDLQKQLLQVANKYIKTGDVDGVRLSTRCDYIDDEVLEMLKSYGVTTIELGVQSMDDEVLKLSNRGHSASCVRNAVSKIRSFNFKLGLQMMIGLCGDTREKSIYTANEIIKLNPDFVRIYPTLVVKDTELENMYDKGKYSPLSLDEAVDTSKELLRLFRNANIDVIRLGLMASDEIELGKSVVAGPVHSSFGELVESAIFFDEICKLIKGRKSVMLGVNPKDLSKAIGNRRMNIKKVKDLFDIDVKIGADDNVAVGNIVIKGDL